MNTPSLPVSVIAAPAPESCTMTPGTPGPFVPARTNPVMKFGVVRKGGRLVLAPAFTVWLAGV